VRVVQNLRLLDGKIKIVSVSIQALIQTHGRTGRVLVCLTVSAPRPLSPADPHHAENTCDAPCKRARRSSSVSLSSSSSENVISSSLHVTNCQRSVSILHVHYACTETQQTGGAARTRTYSGANATDAANARPPHVPVQLNSQFLAVCTPTTMTQARRAGYPAGVHVVSSHGGHQDEHKHEGKRDVIRLAWAMTKKEQAPVLLLPHLLLALAHLSLLLLLRHPRHNTNENRKRRA